MSALERTIVGIIGTLIAAALGWGAVELVNTRASLAVLDVKVLQVEKQTAAVEGIPEKLGRIDERLKAIDDKLASLPSRPR